MAEAISREEIIAFLSGKNAITPCEVCHSPLGWVLPDGETAKVVGLFNPRKEDGGYVMPSAITPAIMLICKNCSHIRLFSENIMKHLSKGGTV